MTDGEEWRLIPGWGYEASSFGRIRSIPSIKHICASKDGRNGAHSRPSRGKILSPKKNSNGYLVVALHPGEISFTVSRLVCLAFHGFPPSDDWHADHINRIRDFNLPSNLRWLSPKQNCSNGARLQGENNGATKLDCEKAVEIFRLSKLMSASKIAKKFGVSASTVRNIRLGIVWSHAINPLIQN